MLVLEVTLHVCGEITFTSREIGRLADTDPYILNTALYYALGWASGRYVDATCQPSYIEETADVASEVYVSPAAPTFGTRPSFITTHYKTSSDSYVEGHYAGRDDPRGGRNRPDFGQRRSLMADTQLTAFMIPRSVEGDAWLETTPGYIRLGKKRGKARLALHPRHADKRHGPFQLGHPIGLYDSEQTPKSDVSTRAMRPTPLVMRARYHGDYLRIDRHQAEHGPERLALPANLEFLTRKR